MFVVWYRCMATILAVLNFIKTHSADDLKRSQNVKCQWIDSAGMCIRNAADKLFGHDEAATGDWR